MNRVAELLASEDEWRGRLRAVGGLLLGTGLVLVFIRRLAFDPWSDVALLVVILAAFAFLYGVGMLAARTTGDEDPWQATFMVFGVLVLPLALFQLVSTIDGSPGAPLNVAWIFAVTALVGAGAGLAGARYGIFLAAVAAIVAWLALWHELLADGIFVEIGTLRVLLAAIGVALLALGAGARAFGDPEDPRRADELLTGGAIALVGAGAISLNAWLGQSALIPGLGIEPTVFWNAYLLAVSVAAIGLALALGIRGIAYAGGVGLAIFIFIVGFDFGAAERSGDLVGWPLVAVIAGAAAFLASLIRIVEEPDDDEEQDDEEQEDEAEEAEAGNEADRGDSEEPTSGGQG